jgi:hypothetical protein
VIQGHVNCLRYFGLTEQHIATIGFVQPEYEYHSTFSIASPLDVSMEVDHYKKSTYA